MRNWNPLVRRGGGGGWRVRGQRRIPRGLVPSCHQKTHVPPPSFPTCRSQRRAADWNAVPLISGLSEDVGIPPIAWEKGRWKENDKRVQREEGERDRGGDWEGRERPIHREMHVKGSFYKSAARLKPTISHWFAFIICYSLCCCCGVTEEYSSQGQSWRKMDRENGNLEPQKNLENIITCICTCRMLKENPDTLEAI